MLAIAYAGLVLVNEVAKHAALSWLIEQLQNTVGTFGVLTFIASHPSVAYGILLASWVAFVFYTASKRQLVQSAEAKLDESLLPTPRLDRSVTGLTHGALSPVAGRDIIQHIHAPQEAAATAPFVMLEFVPVAQFSEFRLVNSGDDAFEIIAESHLTQVGNSQLKLVFNTAGIGVLHKGPGRPIHCEVYRQEGGQLIGCGLGESKTSRFLWDIEMMISQAGEDIATFTVDVSCEDKQRKTHRTTWTIEFSAQRDNPIVRRV